MYNEQIWGWSHRRTAPSAIGLTASVNRYESDTYSRHSQYVDHTRKSSFSALDVSAHCHHDVRHGECTLHFVVRLHCTRWHAWVTASRTPTVGQLPAVQSQFKADLDGTRRQRTVGRYAFARKCYCDLDLWPFDLKI